MTRHSHTTWSVLGSYSTILSGQSSLPGSSFGSRPAAIASASVTRSHTIASTLPLGRTSISWCCICVSSAKSFCQSGRPSHDSASIRPPPPCPVANAPRCSRLPAAHELAGGRELLRQAGTGAGAPLLGHATVGVDEVRVLLLERRDEEVALLRIVLDPDARVLGTDLLRHGRATGDAHCDRGDRRPPREPSHVVPLGRCLPSAGGRQHAIRAVAGRWRPGERSGPPSDGVSGPR